MPSLRGNQFSRFISKGVMGVRSARKQLVQAADDRAKKKIATSHTRAERNTIRANLAIEKLKLERQAFEAEAAAISALATERAKTNKARIAAGRLNPLERATGFLQRTGKSLQELQAANERRANPPRKRAATKKKTTTRRRRDPDDISDLFF